MTENITTNNSTLPINSADDCIPDTTPAGLAYNVWMLVMITACTLFNLSSILACVRQAARLKSPAFYVLANLFLAYIIHLIFDFFMLYLEAATSLRISLPFTLEANLGNIGSGIGTHLVLLFAANRFVCFFATLSYDSIFTTRNTWLAIGVAWLVGTVRQLLRMACGEVREHCWSPGFVHYQLDKGRTVIVKEIPVVQFVEWVQKGSLTLPTVFDVAVLAKLGLERLPGSPFRKTDESVEQQSGYNDRVRTFVVCLATSAYHVLYLYVLYPHITNRDLFHMFNLFATVLPALLILLLSPGYRDQYRNSVFGKCTKKAETAKIHPINVRVIGRPNTTKKVIQPNQPA